MKLRLDQLASHLQKELQPVYLISGDEPLLIQEACQTIRYKAQQLGYTERQKFTVETGFSWEQFLEHSYSLSLFHSQRFLELRLASCKLGDGGSKTLIAYANRLPVSTILLISAPRLDAAAQNTQWYKAIEKVGVHIAIWPIELPQMPQWLKQRLQQVGLQATPEAIQLLCERVEGNLLAATQEIEKLKLLYGNKQLTAEDITSAVTDSARYNIFELIDTVLQGDGKHIVKTLQGLKGEGTEPTLILWALTRELRTLIQFAKAMSQGTMLGKLLQDYHIRDKRKPSFKQSLSKHSLAKWQQFLQHAARIDRIIKGMEIGNVWNELTNLCLQIAGVNQLMTIYPLSELAN